MAQTLFHKQGHGQASQSLHVRPWWSDTAIDWIGLAGWLDWIGWLVGLDWLVGWIGLIGLDWLVGLVDWIG